MTAAHLMGLQGHLSEGSPRNVLNDQRIFRKGSPAEGVVPLATALAIGRAAFLGSRSGASDSVERAASPASLVPGSVSKGGTGDEVMSAAGAFHGEAWPCKSACSPSLHYEIWKYCQTTSKVQAQVPQILRVSHHLIV